MGVVVDNLTHLTLAVSACGIVAQTGEHTVIVGVIGAEHGAVDGGSFRSNEIGAGAALHDESEERRNG